MTLRELLAKYQDEVESMLAGNFKGEYLFESGPYAITVNGAASIYAYCHDGRRGIWINKFVEGGEVKCVQVNAGREGDDACATMCMDKDWLASIADDYDTVVDISEYGSIVYLDSLDEDISEYVTKEICSYGTEYNQQVSKITEVLS